MVILGIDTSCDETAASVLENGKILSNIVYSQSIHKEFGGVVPNLASKDHEKHIYNTIIKAVDTASISLKQIDAIAVTFSPGLISCLLVGLNFAKGLSIGLNVPLIPVNHLEWHLCSNLIDNYKIDMPYLCLLVSGGHTQIWVVNSAEDYKILSTTVDDAAGEAFDKGAKMLGLGYPGGPEIEKNAFNGDENKYTFSIPKIKNNPVNFSFSGIKTSLYYKIKNMNQSEIESEKNHLCASFQEGILNILFDRLKMVIKENNIKDISIVGGVSCNKRFRLLSEKFSENYNVNLHFPENQFCTDNGAMIAMSAYLKNNINSTDNSNLKVVPVPNVKI